MAKNIVKDYFNSYEENCQFYVELRMALDTVDHPYKAVCIQVSCLKPWINKVILSVAPRFVSL